MLINFSRESIAKVPKRLASNRSARSNLFILQSKENLLLASVLQVAYNILNRWLLPVPFSPTKTFKF